MIHFVFLAIHMIVGTIMLFAFLETRKLSYGVIAFAATIAAIVNIVALFTPPAAIFDPMHD